MKGCQPLRDEELDAVLRHGFDHTDYGMRGRAMFLVQLTTGVRISELLSLTLGDFVTQRGQWVQYIHFRRRNTKGRIEGRRRRLRYEIREPVGTWIDVLNRWGGVVDSQPMWCSRMLRPISRQYAYQIYRTAFQKAAVSLSVPGTHTLRKTYADRVYRDLLERLAAGEALDPLRGISHLLGHANIASTESYLAFREEQAEQSVDAVTRNLPLNMA